MKRLLMQDLIRWKSKKDRKPLILNGVRQVGKTYLLTQFGNKHFSNVHCFNFEKNSKLVSIFKEDLNPSHIVTELSFHIGKKIDIKKDLIIFDEIQECPRAVTSLKYFCEELSDATICAAGSLLGIALETSSFPVGKVDMLTLCPMNFEEFLLSNDEMLLEALYQFRKTKKISNTAHEKLLEKLKEYFVVGGLPEAVSVYNKFKEDKFLAFNSVREKQYNLQTAYFADMAKHSGELNAMHLNRIFKAVPSQLAMSLNRSSKFKFRGVVPGISHYSRLVGAIDWLENSGLIYKTFIINYAKIPLAGYLKENRFKLFLFDIGMLGSMLGLSPKSILNYDYGSYKGYFVENFVLQELMSSGIKQVFCWQEKLTEVDFLVENDDKVIPIEVKAGKTSKSKSLDIFSKKYDSVSFIVNANSIMYDSSKNRYKLPLYGIGDFINFL